MTPTRRLARALYATSGISNLPWEELQQGVRTAHLSHAAAILEQLGPRGGVVVDVSWVADWLGDQALLQFHAHGPQDQRGAALWDAHIALLEQEQASWRRPAEHGPEASPQVSVASNPARRTKRRYAHELYPHAGEWETRPLSLEVLYLYARFVGLEVWGTSWFDVEPRTLAGERTHHFIDAARTALLADALAQGMTGDEAWAWANERMSDEMAVPWERAVHYGVPVDAIKPYPCGPEPDHHDHYRPYGTGTAREVIRIPGPESECDECTEPITEGA